MKQSMEVLVSSETNEWYTPARIVETARGVMQGIDLDPASCEPANSWIMADTIYTVEDDGLEQEWHGRVWLNPPRGKVGCRSSQGVWAEKLIAESQAGNVSEGVMLSKSAPGYQWWEKLFRAWPVCMMKDRVKFIRLDERGQVVATGKAKAGTSIWYIGPQPLWEAFRLRFNEYGRIIYPNTKGGRPCIRRSY